MNRLSILLLLFIIDIYSFGQTFNYTHYTVEDGLASTNVYVAFQDSKHFMWLGTDNGVNRFDGKNFEIYTTENGLADNDVLRIFEDSQQRIWFLTIGGHLSYFKDGKIHNERTDPYLSKGYTGAGLFYAIEDNKNRIWFCSYNAVVSVLEKDEFFNIKIATAYPNFGVCVDQDSTGKIFLFSQFNKHLFDENEKKIIIVGDHPGEMTGSYMKTTTGDCFYFIKNKIYKIRNGVSSLCLDVSEFNINSYLTTIENPKNNFYISTAYGTYNIQKTPGKKNIIQKYLPNEWINSTNFDTEGNLWFMTRRNGVFVLPKESKEIKLYNSPYLLNENIQSLVVDNNGYVWIGCNEGQFAFLANDSITNFSLPKNKPVKGNFLCLEKDINGNIWAGSDSYIFKIKLKGWDKKSQPKIISGQKFERTLSVSINSKNEIILGRPMYLSTVEEKNDLLISKSVKDESYYKRTFSVFYDNMDKLYIANIDGLHEKYNGIYTSLIQYDSLLANKIIYMQQTPDSTLLLATEGHGLIFYKNNKVIKHLTHNNGLPSSLCRKVKVYNDNVFVCTNKGLTQFKYKNDSIYNIVNYNKSNSLPSDNVRDVVFSNGKIYVGTSSGLSVLELAYKNSKLPPPPVYIRTVLNNLKPIDWSKPFNIAYKNNDLIVHFNAITFSNPEDIIYEYSFNNEEPQWKLVTLTAMNFPDISPGKYNFLVRARKKESEWSQPESFTVTVNQPIYFTWWFVLMGFLLLITGISLIIIYLNRRKVRVKFLTLEKRDALNMERNRISADMHDDLGSDFSKIAVMAEVIKIKDKNVADVQEDLTKISEFVKGARIKMDDIIWALNPSNDYVGNMIGYINQYCLNFFDGTNIKVNINFNSAIDDVLLNARQRRNIFLVIKEIANNTLKHSSAKKFHLYFTYNKKEIKIEVGDNGKGLQNVQQKEFSNGLNNINQRIAELNGKINIITSPDTGLSYMINIPFNSIL
ncbi:MAG: two-component regulator propeller domain-containing protein [bacterium]